MHSQYFRSTTVRSVPVRNFQTAWNMQNTLGILRASAQNDTLAFRWFANSLTS